MLYRGKITYDTQCTCPRVTLGNCEMMDAKGRLTIQGVCIQCGSLRDQNNKPLIALAGSD